MKILYVVHQFFPTFGSGTEMITYNIASMMQRSGHKVTVVAYAPDMENKWEQYSSEGKIDYRHIMYKTLSVIQYRHQVQPMDITYGFHNEQVLRFADSILRQVQPDIVHVTHLMRGSSFLEAAAKQNIPSIVTLTDLMAVCPRITMQNKQGGICASVRNGADCPQVCQDAVNYRARLREAKTLLKKAKKVTVPSAFLKKMIGDELELPIQIIPHGIFYREGAHSAVQSKKSNLTIGFAGTIIEHKGVSNLIEAFMKVPGRKLQLQIYGSGNLDYVESLKKQAALDGRIHFMGQFKPEDAARIYTSLDLLVIPSTCYESYSMVKHEAIANGTPVAVSNIGALPEKIIHGENGFIFDPFQPETLSKIFQMLKASPEKLQHIQNGMRKLSVDAIEQEAFHYLRIYWDMVKK